LRAIAEGEIARSAGQQKASYIMRQTVHVPLEQPRFWLKSPGGLGGGGIPRPATGHGRQGPGGLLAKAIAIMRWADFIARHR
jgi:hypothetical protein